MRAFRPCGGRKPEPALYTARLKAGFKLFSTPGRSARSERRAPTALRPVCPTSADGLQRHHRNSDLCGPIRVLRPASPRSISRLRHQEKMSSNRTRTGSDTPEYSAISEATKTHNNTPKIAFVYQGSYRPDGELMLVLPPLSTRLARKMFGGCDFL
jgi:hypothetical protein